MPKISKDHIKMKVFPKGQVVIPIALRKKYNINIGDHIHASPEKNGIFLKPSQEGKIHTSLTEHLFGVFNIYATAKSELTKKDISKAVKRGFTEGYRV